MITSSIDNNQAIKGGFRTPKTSVSLSQLDLVLSCGQLSIFG
jgi:hypothetical protein